MPNLAISCSEPINIYPNMKIRNLVKENVSNVNIMPSKKSLNLSFSCPTFCSIEPSPPKPDYNPNILEAFRMLYGKQAR